MQETKRIFGIGRVILDHVAVVPVYPECDTKCLVTEHWRQVGGPVPVALSTARHYGIPAAFLGPWGVDPAGTLVTEVLTERGIDISCCCPTGDTGFAQIWTEQGTGKRTIAAFPGPEISEDRLDASADMLASCQILALDGSSAAVAIPSARVMKQNNGLIVLDAGSKKPAMDELLPLTDVLVASDMFCRSWFGDVHVSLSELLALGCESVIRTRGDRGVSYSNGTTEFHVDAVKINPVDTNGAGDIFCGSLLRGLAESWDIKRSLQFANAVAGYSCQFRGNSTLPNESALEF